MTGIEKKEHLLLIENDISIQKIFETVLDGCNWAVVSTENGDSAIKELKRRRFKGILLELNLPHLDGFEIARHIRRMESEAKTETIPIVAITGSLTDSIRRRCLELGMSGFIQKPIRPDQLCATVGRYLGQPERPA